MTVTCRMYARTITGGWPLLSEPKKAERAKVFELSKFEIFVNKRFKATFNAPVNHSNLLHFLEAKMLSHIESENEMTGRHVLDYF